MRDFISCCGNDCEKCDARIATISNDNEYKEKTAKLWSQLNGVEITADMVNCTGCRIPGVKTPYCRYMCEIRKCAMERQYKTCADCTDLNECETIKPIILNNPQTLKNLIG